MEVWRHQEECLKSEPRLKGQVRPEEGIIRQKYVIKELPMTTHRQKNAKSACCQTLAGPRRTRSKGTTSRTYHFEHGVQSASKGKRKEYRTGKTEEANKISVYRPSRTTTVSPVNGARERRAQSGTEKR